MNCNLLTLADVAIEGAGARPSGYSMGSKALWTLFPGARYDEEMHKHSTLGTCFSGSMHNNVVQIAERTTDIGGILLHVKRGAEG
jgi:hypothetical protein